MDSGTTAHMTCHPGNLTSSTPIRTPTRITVGNGSSLPITHVSHMSFPSTSTPINMINVLVSPDLVMNLVSVRRLAHENPISVKFDDVGFSVKDARTRIVLHLCDSPDELYLVHPSAAATPATSPATLAASVDLWHDRLGHPNSTVLRQILQSFSFSCNKVDNHTCEACRLGKHVRLHFSASTTISNFPFQLLHSDVSMSSVASTRAIYTIW